MFYPNIFVARSALHVLLFRIQYPFPRDNWKKFRFIYGTQALLTDDLLPRPTLPLFGSSRSFVSQTFLVLLLVLVIRL